MGLSLNPADVWRIFSDGEERRKEDAAKWLDELAKEARTMADAWRDVTTTLFAAELETSEEAKKVVRDQLVRKYGCFLPNTPHFYALRDFYTDASFVLGGRVDGQWINVLKMAAGAMIVERRNAATTYGEVMKARGYDRGKRISFVNDENVTANLEDLTRIAEILNREAVALEMLARNFRAKE